MRNDEKEKERVHARKRLFLGRKTAGNDLFYFLLLKGNDIVNLNGDDGNLEHLGHTKDKEILIFSAIFRFNF